MGVCCVLGARAPELPRFVDYNFIARSARFCSVMFCSQGFVRQQPQARKGYTLSRECAALPLELLLMGTPPPSVFPLDLVFPVSPSPTCGTNSTRTAFSCINMHAANNRGC